MNEERKEARIEKRKSRVAHWWKARGIDDLSLKCFKCLLKASMVQHQ